MFRLSLFSPRYCWLGLLFVTVSVLAQVPSPSKEFWDYLEEYGDANGNVLDPLEYDQIINIKNNEKLALKEAPTTNEQTSLDKTIDKKRVSNTDMKVEQRSSAISSSAMKGAKL